MSKIKQDSLEYHAKPSAGKLGISVTKPITNQYELTLAYSPGVAEPVIEIANNPDNAYKYTSKPNLVGVITNGSAILGLGNLGALASKPVMEGKAALFKLLAGVDAFDIEVDEKDPEKLVGIIKAISPTFGAINLEDIKAPECFVVEQKLQDIGIPVIHDDQHGTAIVLLAGLLNACEIQGLEPKTAKVVVYGAGAAAIASVKLMYKLGFKKENIMVFDSKGVINTKRQDLNNYKKELAIDTDIIGIEQAMHKANILIGLAGAGIEQAETLIKTMASKPIMFLLSNPTPEIPIELIEKHRPDALIATGRSDYPNQINNALCFPYLFKGALMARAKNITDSMKIAAVNAIRELAKQPVTEAVAKEYSISLQTKFGKNYIIPKPTDLRLRELVSKAVADAVLE